MKTYQTKEVAKIIGIHPNTVRLYEELELIPKPCRRPNGYRVFTDLHIAQFRLARLAFEIEALQNGLRKKIAAAVKASAAGDFPLALRLTEEYLRQVRKERGNAEEAIQIVTQLLSCPDRQNALALKRKQVSQLLCVSMDTLRNWEMNGLLTVKRKENGYRIYTDEDIRRLKVIRALRCAGYSLEAILRMLNALSSNPEADLLTALNTPRPGDDIISVCDRLISSLAAADANACRMISMLKDMERRFS